MIVGLGNPGAEYRGTRHNIGFDVISRLAARHRINLSRGSSRALIGYGEIESVPVMLVKPLTYMNLSGQAVGPLMRKASLKPENVLVVADDLDLALGKVKLKQKGSSGGHNGHKSLIAAIGEGYPRIKVGIGHGSRAHTIDHVLSDFDRKERDTIDAAIDVAVEACELACTRDLNAALNRIAAYNHLS